VNAGRRIARIAVAFEAAGAGGASPPPGQNSRMDAQTVAAPFLARAVTRAFGHRLAKGLCRHSPRLRRLEVEFFVDLAGFLQVLQLLQPSVSAVFERLPGHANSLEDLA
jgi:hypothetical protein